jgi:phosphoribosylformylglycinamidine synthase
VVRQAVYQPPKSESAPVAVSARDYTADLLKILASPNVASKEWIVRQYDHEVQGGSVVKAFVGVANDGPSDAAVLRPVLESRRGVVIACGMNPRYGDFDTYHMAASAIDEAVRNCVAVGADPQRIAILDNFCWGDCERPETLGSLVRAALACYDVAVGLGTPFISGKDSLNNEFSYVDAAGKKQTIAIPPSLLISAMGQIDDVGRAVTMDFKSPNNLIYLVGITRDELGGSHYALVNGLSGGNAPTVNVETAPAVFAAMHSAIAEGLVRACHDLSEGGLAVAMAEMAFAGGLGAKIDVREIAAKEATSAIVKLFSESNTRFLCEIEPPQTARFEKILSGVVFTKIGQVIGDARLVVRDNDAGLIDADVFELKEAWQATLRF